MFLSKLGRMGSSFGSGSQNLKENSGAAHPYLPPLRTLSGGVTLTSAPPNIEHPPKLASRLLTSIPKFLRNLSGFRVPCTSNDSTGKVNEFEVQTVWRIYSCRRSSPFHVGKLLYSPSFLPPQPNESRTCTSHTWLSNSRPFRQHPSPQLP